MAALTVADPVDATRIIQTALTPVFLLSGIGTLLNVFNQRLARVADHTSHVADSLAAADGDPEQAKLRRHYQRLIRRRSALDASVVLGALAGGTTCAAAFALFLVTIRDSAGSVVELWLFGASLGCTIAALGAFLVDTVLGWHGLRVDGPTPKPRG